jgi:hypothetical protein
MGPAKSIAMTYSDASYLLHYIDRNEPNNIERLLEKKPELLQSKLT